MRIRAGCGLVVALLAALPARAATERRDLGRFDEVRVPAGLAVRVADDGTAAFGQVTVTCVEDALAAVATARKSRTLRVTWAGPGELPAGCAVVLHPDDVRAIVVEDTGPLPTDVAFDLSADHALTRIEGPSIRLSVRGRGQLLAQSVKGGVLHVATDRLACFELKKTVVERLDADLLAGGTGIVAGLDAGEVSVRAAAGASLVLDGQARSADVRASGHAEIDAGPTMVRDARIVASGSARVWIVVTGDAQVTAAGRATVGIPGEPASLVTKVSGRALVR